MGLDRTISLSVKEEHIEAFKIGAHEENRSLASYIRNCVIKDLERKGIPIKPLTKEPV